MISRSRLFIYRMLFGVALLALWELSSGRLIDPFWVSSPSQVFLYLYGIIADGSIFTHLAVTLYETFSGFLIGAIFGIGLGFALGRRETLAVYLHVCELLNLLGRPRRVLRRPFETSA